jgi:Fic family protein
MASSFTFNVKITPHIVSLVADISKLLGRFQAQSSPVPEPKLRRKTLARSLHATAAIEGNTLSLEDVGAILNGQVVVSKSSKEILEVRNAAKAYSRASEFKPWSIKQFVGAHHQMMEHLVTDAGKFRSGQVGVWQDGKVRHVAPPAKRVPQLIDSLFSALERDNSLPLIVKSAIAHYEIEIIHPFSDGNGRMGRLWQHVVLLKESNLFQFCPFESIIYSRQKDYYAALRAADRAADASVFVEFSLESLLAGLNEIVGNLRPKKLTPMDRLELVQEAFLRMEFSRKDYMKKFPEISTATASRDLAMGVECGQLKVVGEKSQARYKF